ncbi:hypothetical protein I3843_11G069300 [Carya illinoinensis]|uniref:PPPDE domain-containing protein n=1 Tax=Carya illinoinensis TaxID=32201 RepID=A0A8T1P1B3_CARIL|nr:deSI-like protein At4g17486 isoform X2 [Carya illinoinensis]KAG6636048.1 hypothetical protein CIPAW_11G083700 [Carya illinoinensis]KAG6687403.1 hypothetical protein I3842_11G069600 [Carya illinoinensis]KAG6687404.1 hypothetical protein I3842_11G069600 [Carya illinoinensis]KAG7955392.1 hypothetical protein I3843_11G069300 [Carya illinoinensis]KAG7955393.1 hypothetical protein I3843_11G069300 [Carya illinoinensis]
MRLFPLSSSSSSSAQNDQNERVKKNLSPLYLNVYDLTPVNNYLCLFGVGVFHSGIEVHGLEYGFGAHEYSSSGVFEVEPRSCPGFIFRRSVLLGSTDMSHSEFRLFVEHLSAKYHGDTYHLISKNCNHFTDEVCTRLTGKPIPRWVNRLARLGSFCNCLLPEIIEVTAVRHLPDNPTFSDDNGSESSTSFASAVTEENEPNHHLLTPSNGDVVFIKEKSGKLARELM